MKLSAFSRTLIQGVLPGALVVALAFPPDIFAQAAEQDHIVSSQALQKHLETSSAARQRNITTVAGFLSSPMADRAMRDAHVSPVQVQTAIPTLSDEELANLASRAADAQQKFAAGAMSNEMLLLIILVAVVLIIVAVKH
jgi:hypothetical protein